MKYQIKLKKEDGVWFRGGVVGCGLRKKNCNAVQIKGEKMNNIYAGSRICLVFTVIEIIITSTESVQVLIFSNRHKSYGKIKFVFSAHYRSYCDNGCEF